MEKSIKDFCAILGLYHVYRRYRLCIRSTLYTSTLYTSTLYTSTLYTSTLYTSTLYTSTLYTSTLYTSTLYTSTLSTSTLYTSTLYTSTLYTSTLYTSTLYTSTLYTSTLYTSTLYTSTLYTSTLYTSTLYNRDTNCTQIDLFAIFLFAKRFQTNLFANLCLQNQVSASWIFLQTNISVFAKRFMMQSPFLQQSCNKYWPFLLNAGSPRLPITLFYVSLSVPMCALKSLKGLLVQIAPLSEEHR